MPKNAIDILKQRAEENPKLKDSYNRKNNQFERLQKEIKSLQLYFRGSPPVKEDIDKIFSVLEFILNYLQEEV